MGDLFPEFQFTESQMHKYMKLVRCGKVALYLGECNFLFVWAMETGFKGTQFYDKNYRTEWV